MKWNPFLAMSFPGGDIYNFDLDAFYAGTRSTVIPNAPPGFSYPGDPGFAGKSGVNSRYNIWDPRVGFAWDVGGDGRTAVRGGAGIAHDFIKMDLHQNTSSVSPFRLTVQQAAVSFDNPWAGYGCNPFPYTYNPSNPVFPPYGSYLPLPADLKPTKQYRGTSASSASSPQAVRVGHLHRQPDHQPDERRRAESRHESRVRPVHAADADRAGVLPGVHERRQHQPAAAAQPGESHGQPRLHHEYTDIGYQDYNGLLLNSRLDIGAYLNLNANYTLSKCAGLPTPGFGGGLLNPGGNTMHQPYQNNGPADLTMDEGPCAADRRHSST